MPPERGTKLRMAASVAARAFNCYSPGMSKRQKVGRNDPCPCGVKSEKGKPIKYKNHCGRNAAGTIPQEVLEHFANLPHEPFERGGFLTGRPFITTIFKDRRMRAVRNKVESRPLTETFHIYLFRRFFNTLSQEWVESEEKKAKPHPLILWSRETQAAISAAEGPPGTPNELREVKFTGGMRSLLAIAYDFYSVDHCGAEVPQKLLNRLRDENQFQGARYEIAVAGLACRAGFEIKWSTGEEKHCEFTGIHKITGDKAAFEAKSHHRGGVLGRDGEFNPEEARVKVTDHVREALEQAPDEDIPLVIFDDLNLPLTEGRLLHEKEWFKKVEEQLKKFGFFSKDEYQRCGVLFLSNFSWHFHYDIPPADNEMLAHFSHGGKYSLKKQTVDYLILAARQYGFVPGLAHEYKEAFPEDIK